MDFADQFQWLERALCTFCSNYDAGVEEIFGEDELAYVMRAKDMKGHDERLVVVSKQHTKNPPKDVQKWARIFGLAIARQVYERFPNLNYISLLEDTKSRYLGHWHQIICDLDPDAQDYDQIIKDTEYTEYPVKVKLIPGEEQLFPYMF